MRYYETLCLINPNLPDDDYGEIITKFTNLVEKNKGVVIHIDDWGKKTLAYLVKKFDKGYYVLFQYCAEGDSVAKIERDLRLDERILKYQTVKLSDEEDPEALKAKAEEAKEPVESPIESVDGEEAEATTGSAEDLEQSTNDDED